MIHSHQCVQTRIMFQDHPGLLVFEPHWSTFAYYSNEYLNVFVELFSQETIRSKSGRTLNLDVRMPTAKWKTMICKPVWIFQIVPRSGIIETIFLWRSRFICLRAVVDRCCRCRARHFDIFLINGWIIDHRVSCEWVGGRLFNLRRPVGTVHHIRHLFLLPFSPTVKARLDRFIIWRTITDQLIVIPRQTSSPVIEIHAFLIIVHGRGLFDSDNQILLLTITFSFSETHAFVLQRFNEMTKLIIYRETYVTSNFGQKCHICRFIYILFHLWNFKPQIWEVINISITATL